MMERNRKYGVLHTNGAILGKNSLFFFMFCVLVFPLKRENIYPERELDKGKRRRGRKGNEFVCLANSSVQRTISGTFSVFDGSKSNRKHVKRSPD